MSETCPHCTFGTVREGHNHLAYKCQDCDGTGHISYCALCDDQIPGTDVLCPDCEEEDEERMEREEFVEWLTDANSEVSDLMDRMPEQKPQKILMAI